MKKYFLVAVVLCGFLGVLSAKPKEITPIEIEKPVEIQCGNWTINCFPQVELTLLLGRLAEYPALKEDFWTSSAYLEGLDDLFEQYKDAKILKTLAKWQKDFKFTYRELLAVAYLIKSDFTGVEVDLKKMPETLPEKVRKSLKKKDIENFAADLYSFAAECNYEKIYSLYSPFVEVAAESLKNTLIEAKLPELINQYFGDCTVAIHTTELAMGRDVCILTGSKEKPVYNLFMTPVSDKEAVFRTAGSFYEAYSPNLEKYKSEHKETIDAWILGVIGTDFYSSIYSEEVKVDDILEEMKTAFAFDSFPEFYHLFDEFKETDSKYSSFTEFYPVVIEKAETFFN